MSFYGPFCRRRSQKSGDFSHFLTESAVDSLHSRLAGDSLGQVGIVVFEVVRKKKERADKGTFVD
jgi:hypothetical protein